MKDLYFLAVAGLLLLMHRTQTFLTVCLFSKVLDTINYGARMYRNVMKEAEAN